VIVSISIRVILVTDIASLTVPVFIAATPAVCSSSSTFRVIFRAVIVITATFRTLLIRLITVVAVLVVRNVTHLSTVSTAHPWSLAAWLTLVVSTECVWWTVIVLFAPTAVLIIALGVSVLWAVVMSSTTVITLVAIAPVAVIVLRDVADLIPPVAFGVFAITVDWDWFAITIITLVIFRAILVFLAATAVLLSIMATNWVQNWAVLIVDATWLAVVSITVEAVFMVGNFADSIPALALLIGIMTSRIVRHAPVTVVTFVSIRTVRVLKTLGRTVLVDANLPGMAVTGLRYVSAVTLIHLRPDTGGTLGPVVEPFIECESPMELLVMFILTERVALGCWLFIKSAAGCTLYQASLQFWATLPESTAVC